MTAAVDYFDVARAILAPSVPSPALCPECGELARCCPTCGGSGEVTRQKEHYAFADHPWDRFVEATCPTCIGDGTHECLPQNCDCCANPATTYHPGEKLRLCATCAAECAKEDAQ